METVAFTVAGSAVTAAVVAVITYLLTKRREHEADWRKLKFGQYQELLAAMSGITEGRSTPEAQARYSDAVNSMSLVASPSVLRALHAFQSEISCQNTKRSLEKHDHLLGALIRAMRSDMLPRGSRDADDIEFRLITTPQEITGSK